MPDGEKAPELVFLAGPNGAGKSTFFETHLKGLRLYFVNADEITRQLEVPNIESAKAADTVRAQLIVEEKPFITETVFSDPIGAKLGILKNAVTAGYDVRLIYIGLASPMLSQARVAQRVGEGGHDVPTERLDRRYRQSLENLAAAMEFVPRLYVYDNTSDENPFRLVLIMEHTRVQFAEKPLPVWLAGALRRSRSRARAGGT